MRNSRLPAVLKPSLIALLIILLPAGSQAAGLDTEWIDLTQHRTGYTALILFTLAYLLVMSEEFTHMRKSKPVILAAGAIWGLIAWQYHTLGLTHAAGTVVTGHTYRRRRWQPVIDRLGSRSCTDGAGAREVHLLYSS